MHGTHHAIARKAPQKQIRRVAPTIAKTIAHWMDQWRKDSGYLAGRQLTRKGRCAGRSRCVKTAKLQRSVEPARGTGLDAALQM